MSKDNVNENQNQNQNVNEEIIKTATEIVIKTGLKDMSDPKMVAAAFELAAAMMKILPGKQKIR